MSDNICVSHIQQVIQFQLLKMTDNNRVYLANDPYIPMM